MKYWGTWFIRLEEVRKTLKSPNVDNCVLVGQVFFMNMTAGFLMKFSVLFLPNCTIPISRLERAFALLEQIKLVLYFVLIGNNKIVKSSVLNKCSTPSNSNLLDNIPVDMTEQQKVAMKVLREIPQRALLNPIFVATVPIIRFCTETVMVVVYLQCHLSWILKSPTNVFC